MPIGGGVLLAILGILLLYVVAYLPIRTLVRRHRLWRYLQSAADPEFRPSELYVHGGQVGIAVDIVGKRFAVATPATVAVLEAGDITDIRIRDYQQFGGAIVDIDLRSATIPTIRFLTAFYSSHLMRTTSLLKSLKTDARDRNAVGEMNQPVHEVLPTSLLTSTRFEQELAALRHEVSRVAAALDRLGDLFDARTKDSET